MAGTEPRYGPRQRLGVVLFDLPRYARALRPRWLAGRETHAWILARNRAEVLSRAPDGPGVECSWQWTSELHAPKVFPGLGRLLLRRALEDFPIVLSELQRGPRQSSLPDVTFVIGHRGAARSAHLMLTLRSIAAQVDATVECIVVEQDEHPRIHPSLPGWVRYLHTPTTPAAIEYCRAWALNVGARQAKGRVLVLHDGDMLVPTVYAAAVADRHRRGFEVMNLKRFVFYLTEGHTARIFLGGAQVSDESPESVIQNLEAGGSVAVDRHVYETLGGFDEEFVGWGGEDNEFWGRALTRRAYRFGHLPIVHLWHPPQPGKRENEGRGAATAALTARRLTLPALTRIEELSARAFGEPHREAPPAVSRRDAVDSPNRSADDAGQRVIR
jgi:hypothetical protein